MNVVCTCILYHNHNSLRRGENFFSNLSNKIMALFLTIHATLQSPINQRTNSCFDFLLNMAYQFIAAKKLCLSKYPTLFLFTFNPMPHSLVKVFIGGFQVTKHIFHRCYTCLRKRTGYTTHQLLYSSTELRGSAGVHHEVPPVPRSLPRANLAFVYYKMRAQANIAMQTVPMVTYSANCSFPYKIRMRRM